MNKIFLVATAIAMVIMETNNNSDHKVLCLTL